MATYAQRLAMAPRTTGAGPGVPTQHPYWSQPPPAEVPHNYALPQSNAAPGVGQEFYQGGYGAFYPREAEDVGKNLPGTFYFDQPTSKTLTGLRSLYDAPAGTSWNAGPSPGFGTNTPSPGISGGRSGFAPEPVPAPVNKSSFPPGPDPGTMPVPNSAPLTNASTPYPNRYLQGGGAGPDIRNPVGQQLAIENQQPGSQQPWGNASATPMSTAERDAETGFSPWVRPPFNPATTTEPGGYGAAIANEGFTALDAARGQVPYLQGLQDLLARNIYQDTERPDVTMRQFTPALQEMARRDILEPAASRGVLNSSMTGENMMRLLPEIAMQIRNAGQNRALQAYPFLQTELSRVFDPAYQGVLSGELTKRYGITPPSPSILGGFIGGLGAGAGQGLNSLF